MKGKYIDVLFMIGWTMVGVHRMNEKDYVGVFVASCILMFSTVHYFYSKIVEQLKQNKEEYTKELEEIVSYFKEDGIYALKGLEDKINNLKNQNKDENIL